MFGFVPSGVMVETMTTGKPYQIKAMIVDFSNILLTWPDSKKVEEGLRKLEFLVVMDFYMTETAQLADIILPAAMFLEKTGFYTSSGRSGLDPGKTTNFIMLKEKVVEPESEIWPDWKFWFELAKRMGYGEFFPWSNIEQAIEYRLAPTKITIEELRRQPTGVFLGAPVRYKKYEDKGFRTPSGKIEIYCEELKKLGYDPLPHFKEPMESPISQTKSAEEFPLILTTGSKVLTYTHSSFRGLSFLRNITPEALGELHPLTAEELGINDGDNISIKTRRGGIEVKVTLTDSIHPQVISIPHGWKQANANILTDHKLRNPILGTPELRALLCRVEKSRLNK
jgi:anaerobic selenocysteine-containing dehydrogenase